MKTTFRRSKNPNIINIIVGQLFKDCVAVVTIVNSLTMNCVYTQG